MPEATGFEDPESRSAKNVKAPYWYWCLNRIYGNVLSSLRFVRAPLLSKSHKYLELLIKGVFRPKSIAKDISMGHRESGWSKKYNKELFSHENIESNSLDSTQQSDYWPQEVSNSVVGSSALDRSTQVNPRASPSQVILVDRKKWCLIFSFDSCRDFFVGGKFLFLSYLVWSFRLNTHLTTSKVRDNKSPKENFMTKSICPFGLLMVSQQEAGSQLATSQLQMCDYKCPGLFDQNSVFQCCSFHQENNRIK